MRQWGTKKLSSKRAASAVAMLLSGCTAERLASFTGASLAAAYNVPPAKAEEMLAAAKEARL